jgi:hypothetical protein
MISLVVRPEDVAEREAVVWGSRMLHMPLTSGY